MARYLLILLNDVLTWLNPILGCVAAMLVVLVLQAADEYFARNATSPAIPAKIASAVECRDAGMPHELQEMRFYD